MINRSSADLTLECCLPPQSMDHFDDIGPSVVMASPGMMQSGLSRELFESWCTDKRNGVIIAGYCVEGTLAKVRLSSDGGEEKFWASEWRTVSSSLY